MPQEFHVLCCFKCSTFQVQQVKKVKKWACKMCGEKQSVQKVYGQGSGVDCRKHVQTLNMLRAGKQDAAPNEEGSYYEDQNCDRANSDASWNAKCGRDEDGSPLQEASTYEPKSGYSSVRGDGRGCDLAASTSTISEHKTVKTAGTQRVKESSKSTKWAQYMEKEEVEVLDVNVHSYDASVGEWTTDRKTFNSVRTENRKLKRNQIGKKHRESPYARSQETTFKPSVQHDHPGTSKPKEHSNYLAVEPKENVSKPLSTTKISSKEVTMSKSKWTAFSNNGQNTTREVYDESVKCLESETIPQNAIVTSCNYNKQDTIKGDNIVPKKAVSTSASKWGRFMANDANEEDEDSGEETEDNGQILVEMDNAEVEQHNIVSQEVAEELFDDW